MPRMRTMTAITANAVLATTKLMVQNQYQKVIDTARTRLYAPCEREGSLRQSMPIVSGMPTAGESEYLQTFAPKAWTIKAQVFDGREEPYR